MPLKAKAKPKAKITAKAKTKPALTPKAKTNAVKASAAKKKVATQSPAKKTDIKKAAVKKTAQKSPAKKSPAQKTVAPKKANVKAKPAVIKSAKSPQKNAPAREQKQPIKKIADAAQKVSKAKSAHKTQSKTVPLPVKPAKKPEPLGSVEILRDKILKALDDGKAQNIIMINLAGKTAIADYMIVASGTSSRQVIALGQRVRDCMAEKGRRINLEGTEIGDWVLVDNGDIIVHLFRPEVRAFYQLEKLWSFDFASSQHFRDM